MTSLHLCLTITYGQRQPKKAQLKSKSLLGSRLPYGSPREIWTVAHKTLTWPMLGKCHLRLSSSAWRAASMGACLLSIIRGCPRTVASPRAFPRFCRGCQRRLLGLPRGWGLPPDCHRQQAVTAISSTVRIRFISHSFSREDDKQAKNEASYNTKRRYLTC